jgi:hypothetical protein
MLRLALMAASFLVSVFAVSAQFSGFRYESVTPGTKLPGGIIYLGGALLTDTEKDPVYGVSQVRRGKTMSFWLEISVKRDENGISMWRVLDSVSFPVPAQGRFAVLPSDPAVECRLKGKSVENLVAVGRADQRKGRFLPERAWLADSAKGRFESLRPADMRCIFSEP